MDLWNWVALCVRPPPSCSITQLLPDHLPAASLQASHPDRRHRRPHLQLSRLRPLCIRHQCRVCGPVVTCNWHACAPSRTWSPPAGTSSCTWHPGCRLHARIRQHRPPSDTWQHNQLAVTGRRWQRSTEAWEPSSATAPAPAVTAGEEHQQCEQPGV
jgi:hypothetical protein